ncbi:MAG: sodium/hydrogen antiporter, partial [Actinomycetota bacterium]|nr:sodium/hydrogen antiporter [Actinomycetota bacterium]
ALLLGAMLAPTDAALGAATVLNKAVPVRIRRLLNVESGLNDGLATPVVMFAIAALAGEEGLTAPSSAWSALLEIAIGAGLGAGVGFGAGLLARKATERTLATPRGLTVAVLMMPLFAYTFAGAVDGNGFIAAFVTGTFFAAAWRRRSHDGSGSLELTESIAEPMGDATWLIFGLLAVPLLLVGLGWQEVVFAVCALTVLRMLPVALSLLGTGLRPQTMVFIGWFGPRGLASVVFSLIALESLEMDAALEDVLATAALTIILSVILHGVTATPWARKYGDWVRRVKPTAERLGAAEEPHSRGRLAPDGAADQQRSLR